MEEFKFYIDRKVSSWERETFSIMAESKKEAIDKVIEKTKDDEFFEGYTESLYDCNYYLTPEENSGCSTVELFDGETCDELWNNSLE